MKWIPQGWRIPLPVAASLLIIVIAALAAANMWILYRLYQGAIHESAAQSVLDLGQRLAFQLASHPFIDPPGDGTGERESFSHFVQSVGMLEPAVQYISVSEGGTIRYHRQLHGLAADGPAESAGPPDGLTRIDRRALHLADRVVPVMTFTRSVSGSDGIARSVQVGIQRDAVAFKESAPRHAMQRVFRAALATVCVSFGLCILLVIGLVRRDLQRQARRRAEEHLAFAGALADGIIHDIRNPMSSARLDAQMLQRETTRDGGMRADRVHRLAERMQSTIDRTDKVLAEFLYAAAPSSGGREAFDLNSVVGDCLALLAARFENRSLALDHEAAPQPLSVVGRPTQLKRALINILVNAVQASPDGGRIRVRVRAEGGQAIVEIVDEGAGIPPADRRRVFDMFYTTRPGGTGIGLALARTAVESHGGRIVIEDGDGRGTRVVVRLPLGVAAPAVAPATEGAPS
jgi:signal transduction histidine kinase